MLNVIESEELLDFDGTVAAQVLVKFKCSHLAAGFSILEIYKKVKNWKFVIF